MGGEGGGEGEGGFGGLGGEGGLGDGCRRHKHGEGRVRAVFSRLWLLST